MSLENPAAGTETLAGPLEPAAPSESAAPLNCPETPEVSLTVLKSSGPARGRGDKRRWTTPAQLEWLLSQFPAYLEAQSQGRYDKFWPGFFRDWFELFPVREPTAEDPSDSEGESEDDMVSDNEDNDKEEADKSSGATSKRKRGATDVQKSKKKSKKLVSPLAFFASSRGLYCSNIFCRNCLSHSHPIRRNRASLLGRLRR